MLKHLLFTIIFFGLISCSAYQKTSVSLNDAVDLGKVKVITNSGNKIKLESIADSSSVFYGKRDGIKIPINKDQVESVYLIDTTYAELKKNTIFGTLAAYNFSINYERQIIKAKTFNFLLKANLGRFYIPKSGSFVYPSYPAETGAQFLLVFVGLSGRNSSFLEYGIGLGSWYHQTTYMNEEESYSSGNSLSPPKLGDYIEFLPALNLGYRYQKADNNLLLRIGGGYPEYLYFSVGVCF